MPNLAGKRCEVVLNGETVLTGIIGNQHHDKAKGQRSLRLTGRDLAAPWKTHIKTVLLKADKNPTLGKIDIEPGESVWQALTHIANSVGLHMWLEADGSLVVGVRITARRPWPRCCGAKPTAAEMWSGWRLSTTATTGIRR